MKTIMQEFSERFFGDTELELGKLFATPHRYKKKLIVIRIIKFNTELRASLVAPVVAVNL